MHSLSRTTPRIHPLRLVRVPPIVQAVPRATAATEAAAPARQRDSLRRRGARLTAVAGNVIAGGAWLVLLLLAPGAIGRLLGIG